MTMAMANVARAMGIVNKGGGQATTRAMAAAMTVVGNNEGNRNGDEQATKRVRCYVMGSTLVLI
jgi:hypothetical protein